jgi:hypothetical protein
LPAQKAEKIIIFLPVMTSLFLKTGCAERQAPRRSFFLGSSKQQAARILQSTMGHTSIGCLDEERLYRKDVKGMSTNSQRLHPSRRLPPLHSSCSSQLH